MHDRSSLAWLVGLALAAAGLFVLGWWPSWTGAEPLLGSEAIGASACVLIGLCLSRLAWVGVRLARVEAELARAHEASQGRGPQPVPSAPALSHRLRELGIEGSAPEGANGTRPGRGAPHAA